MNAEFERAAPALNAAVIEKPKEAAVEAVVGQRILPIDALRGVAMIAMALDHVAAFMLVSLQAETYGGIPAVLESWPRWVAGLFTNVAAPTFWLLSGVSVVLLEASRKKRGDTSWQISRFLLIRAALILLLDMTVCELTWAGKGPYTHVLLSIGISLIGLSLLRMLPVYVIASVSIAMLVGYQTFLPQIAANFSQTDHFWLALSISYSTHTVPAVEFSLLGWGGLMGLGYALGKGIFGPSNGKTKYLGAAVPALLAVWLALRLLGSFGDLVPYSPDQPWYFFFVMSKTPPSLTYLTFNLGLAGMIFLLFASFRQWLTRPPLQWLVLFGQVSLFFFVIHIGVFGLLGRLALSLQLPLPGILLLLVVWVAGLGVMLPISSFYRKLRKRYPILRYL